MLIKRRDISKSLFSLFLLSSGKLRPLALRHAKPWPLPPYLDCLDLDYTYTYDQYKQVVVFSEVGAPQSRPVEFECDSISNCVIVPVKIIGESKLCSRGSNNVKTNLILSLASYYS